jgi:hypothetical protein
MIESSPKGANMSNPTHPISTPTGEFQAHFGAAPGSPDLVAECRKWEKLCGELLAEREKLRAELLQTQREFAVCRKSLFHLVFKDDPVDFDVAEALVHVDDKPTIEEIIAEFAQTPGK